MLNNFLFSYCCLSSLVSCLSDVTNTNAFIEEDSSLAGLSLWKLMKATSGTVFNNVAQVNYPIGSH